MAGLQSCKSQKKKNLQQKNFNLLILKDKNMKKQLIIYAILIVIFFAYNQFFRVKDDQLNDLINIIFSSFYSYTLHTLPL